MPAIPGAIEACHRLRDAGFDLVCVSALDLEYEAARLRNLRALGFPIERVVATGNAAGERSPKAEAIERLRPLAFVDDYLPYLRGLPADVHTALVLRAPNGSPNAGAELAMAKSVHQDLVEFADHWLGLVASSVAGRLTRPARRLRAPPRCYLSHAVGLRALGILASALEDPMRPSTDVDADTDRSRGRSASLRGLRRFAIATWAALILAGCAGTPPPSPTVVAVTLQTTMAVNPDLRQRASPLVVRIYELKSSAAFEGADFVSLFERDQAALGAEMASREEFVLQPGETRPWQKTAAPDAKFIGVMAAFRDIERARWKASIAIKPNVTNVIAVRADEISITARAVPP